MRQGQVKARRRARRADVDELPVHPVRPVRPHVSVDPATTLAQIDRVLAGR